MCSCSSVVDFLNSLMPLPSDFPISGSRLGPKITSTITNMAMISGHPKDPNIFNSLNH